MPRRTDPLLSLPDKGGILYIRLYQRMRALIMQGSWPPGMRLPSSRQLAADVGVSRNTATLALDQLLADGSVETRSRAGTFVSGAPPALAQSGESGEVKRTASAGRPPVPFEMNHNALDAFPFDRWARLQSKIWSTYGPELLYEGDPAGDIGLRQAIAGVVLPLRGITVSANQVIVIGGTQSGYDLIAACLPKGATVVVEDPGYRFSDTIFRQRGCRIVTAPVDRDGIDVARARRAAPSPHLIITTSASQFPIGVPLSEERRRMLHAWAEESGAWIIDDEFEAGARFDGIAPTPSLKADDSADRVIVASSISRMLFRSLRLGFLVVPAKLVEAILAARAASDGFEPLPNQLVLREFIDRGLWSAHQRQCREIYAARRQALMSALAPYLGALFDEELNPCGLHLLLRPRVIPASDIAAALRAGGIACLTLSQLSRSDDAHEGVLLGFASFAPDVIDAMRPGLDRALQPLLAKATAKLRSG